MKGFHTKKMSTKSSVEASAKERRVKGKGKHASSTENRRMVWEKIIWPLILDVNRSYFSLKEYHIKNFVKRTRYDHLRSQAVLSH
jgi:hypothetical protein